MGEVMPEYSLDSGVRFVDTHHIKPNIALTFNS